jgi:hypothetical protein
MRALVVLGLLLVAATVGAVSAGSAEGRASSDSVPGAAAGSEPVVPSLDPAATAKLWRELTTRRSYRARATDDCRPLRAVFYVATDWLRLATNLAENASPCAQYYISIPSLVADRTAPRPNQAWRVRALGPNFHAMAEINFTGWNKWVQSTGSSWYTAGTTARARMQAAGYDVALGDTWALNEISSAVRKGTGVARANIREFLRGLYDGGGTHPTRGAVFVIGVGQRTTDPSLYQINLQNWFADSSFWTDMNTYVSDWSQEVYGDVRSWAAPGAATSDRRDHLNDYLQHELVLAESGPPSIDTARSYLQSAFSPLANAAWQRASGYGWTMVSSDQMGAYVSGQVAALRYFSATTGQPQDHWGFAWAPKNPDGLPAAQFTAQTDEVVRRLAAAIHDSGDPTSSPEPGSGACGPQGQNTWCVGDLDGAKLTEVWKSFRTWSQPVLAFTTPSPTIAAGAPSAALGIKLVTGTGLAVTTPAPLVVTLSSSSIRGTFSTSPSGPWSSTVSLTIAPGTGTSPAFYYEDTVAGSPALTASATGATSGTLAVTITSGSIVSLTVKPASSIVPARTTKSFTAIGTDSFGNKLSVNASWTLDPPALGTVAPRTGGASTFTSGRQPGGGTITASVLTAAGPVSGAADVQVVPARIEIGSIRYLSRKNVVLVRVAIVDGAGKPVSGTTVGIVVRRAGRRLFTARKVTGPAGGVDYGVQTRLGGCFTTTVTRASAVGFRWNGTTPPNRYCRPAPAAKR